MAPQYITGTDLAELIRAGNKDHLVVDVRDDDYAGGNIVGSVNIPSRQFLMNVDGLVKKAREEKLGKVIFHCSLSQARGPKAARIFEETYTNVRSDSDPIPEVFILRDGFSQFQVHYKSEKDLVENWDKEVWESEWS